MEKSFNGDKEDGYFGYIWLFGKRVRLHAKQMQNLCVCTCACRACSSQPLGRVGGGC